MEAIARRAEASWLTRGRSEGTGFAFAMGERLTRGLVTTRDVRFWAPLGLGVGARVEGSRGTC